MDNFMDHFLKDIKIDGRKFDSKENAYNHLRKVLELPDYFGNNLDALWDVLDDMKNVEIEIISARDIVKNLGDYGIKMLDVFGDLQEKDNIKVEILW